MATKIRGTADNPTRMLLGQIRKVFDPDWIQAFESGRFTVQFENDTDARDEMIQFAEMYGFSLSGTEDDVWSRYYFE